MPDGLQLSVVCRVMEMVLTMHMGLFNPEKSHLLRELVTSSRGWQGQELPWKGLCYHSPLNEPEQTLPSTLPPLLRNGEVEDCINRLAPDFLRLGWERRRVVPLVRKQLMTEEREVATIENREYNANYRAQRRVSSTPEQIEDDKANDRKKTGVWRTRVRAIGADSKWWTIARLTKHGLHVHLDKVLSAAELRDISKRLKSLEDHMGYKEEFLAKQKASNSVASAKRSATRKAKKIGKIEKT